MSGRTTFLLTSLLLHPLCVTCLKCYVGVEGAGNVTEVDVENPEKYMCSFMVRGACSFPDKDPPVYTVYIEDKVYLRRCWYGDGVAVCSCKTDLCNGDIELIGRLWDKTKIKDENVHECVSEYLKRWLKLPSFRKKEVEQKSTDIVSGLNDEEPEHQRISGFQTGPKTTNTKTEDNSDFIIFLVLVIVAVVLLIAIIPACIGCMALDRKRKQKREEYVSLRTGKSTRGRSERSNKSMKSTTSANSLKSGKSSSRRRGGRNAKSTRSRSETKRSSVSGKRSRIKGRKD